MRRPILAANWKMFKTGSQGREFVLALAGLLSSENRADVVICPPFTALESVGQAVAGRGEITLGAQNVHWETEGAFTGEVAASMLADLGVRYVIVGHSERRHLFGDSDSDVNRKVKRLFDEELTPILCVGETLDEREAGRTETVVGAQLEGGLAGVERERLERIVVAYEPIWAIGTGVAATPLAAEEVIRFIRGRLSALGGREIGEAVRIQYGGSVKPDNIGSFMASPDVDGALVGGASLDPTSFGEIVKESIEAKARAHSL